MKLNKKLTATMAAMCAVGLIAGCGGKGSGTPIPKRAEVTTPPAATFTFGTVEGKAYAISGIDLKLLGAYNLIATDNALYMQGQSLRGIFSKTEFNKRSIVKADVNKEEVTNISVLGGWEDKNIFATNGKGAVWVNENCLNWYDGTEVKVGGVPPVFEENYVFMKDTNNIYFANGDKVEKAAFENGVIRNIRTAIKKEDVNALGVQAPKVEFVDDDYIYLAKNIEQNGASVPTLFVMQHSGKLAYRLEGVTNMPRAWAVTTNYIIHAGSRGDMVVYNKDTGKEIGKAKVEGIRIYDMATAKGNDVFVTDDRNRKLYRFDF